MSHTIKTLFSDFGVNETVYELDEISKGKEIEGELSRLSCSPSIPTVYIRGAKQVMTLHLSRTLKPMLEDVGDL